VKKVVNGVPTVSIYSGGHVIAEYDNGAAATSPTREYIYGNNLLAIVTGSTSGSGGTIVYQHRDHLSPRLYTNSTAGDSGEQGTYPFGEPWYNNNTTSNWVFATYERDAESGIDYALSRFYYSSEGRFMSPDPLAGNPANPQSWNRYAYSLNDPINGSDPVGRDSCDSEDICSDDPPTGGATWDGNQLTVGGAVFGNITGNPWGVAFVDPNSYSVNQMTGEVDDTGTFACTTSVCGYLPNSYLSGTATSGSDAGSTSGGFSGLDAFQLGLAGVGFVPGPVGQVANGANGIVSIARGHYWAGAASLGAAFLPVAGGLISDAGRSIEVEAALATGTRYVGPQEAQLIEDTGLVPNTDVALNPKSVFYTPESPLSSASEAQQAYQLGSTPTHVVELDTTNISNTYGGNVDGSPWHTEMITHDQIPVTNISKLNP
jgi:RHS repeat-associated protein